MGEWEVGRRGEEGWRRRRWKKIERTKDTPPRGREREGGKERSGGEEVAKRERATAEKTSPHEESKKIKMEREIESFLTIFK